MEKDMIFFGEGGITQTHANYLANIAKELYMSAETALNSMKFYGTEVKLIGSSESNTISAGYNADAVVSIPGTMAMIADLKSLIAWLREAIKAKERLILEAQNGSYEYYGLECPKAPSRMDYITADDCIAQMTVKQRNRYYYLEALCATIGQYIHPHGTFAQQREVLHEVISEPNHLEGEGRDALLYTRIPSVSGGLVEETFLKLQNTYREYQAELNSIKYSIETTVNQDTACKNIEYSEAVQQYQKEMSVLDAELSRKRKEAVTAATLLKIIIPDDLKHIYERVRSAGK